MNKKLALIALMTVALGAIADDGLKWIDVNSQIAAPTVYVAAPQALTAPPDGFSSWWRTFLASEAMKFSSKFAGGLLLFLR